jgi:hypothetical protein
MGTSGSYTGSGGKLGDDLRDNINDWLNADPGPSPPTPPEPPDGDPDPREQSSGPQSRPRLDPNALLPIVGMLRPRTSGSGSGDGPGGGGGEAGGGGGGRRGGGPQRSAAASAGSAGRAAAAAYAYRTGDAATLERLGLDFNALSALGDPFLVTREIVEAVCGSRGDSTIEDHEQRLVAAAVAEWVLTEQDGGAPPRPEEIVRHTIALVISEAVASETGELFDESNRSDVSEQDILDAAEALAARAQLSADGASEDDFSRAIEQGIEALRNILDGGDS